MSTIGASKTRERRAEEPTQARVTLWRITRAAGGLRIEEVEAPERALTVKRTLVHEIYDLAMTRLSSEVWKRMGG